MACSSKIIVVASTTAAAPRLSLLVSHSPHLFPFANSGFRASHWSAYEKNQEDPIWPTMVPNDVIHHNLSDNYWVPHPQTGVFGPPKAHHDSSTLPNDTSAGGNEGGSVLNLKAWFRHNGLEDLEKPHSL
ncbi:uncharacterized protein E6C27_scaffold231G00300 [Cucumis melo var. makuwa]|uniref:Uncharacterized protein n=1 Tax=Cucumis melo var. makuwa TaxID=1194695 RepID=A0A5A7UIY1_CUCMM|nr:uncharacterized protein E6C27_scaffold231G00300 [Cucumis melo var. makuwa]